MPDFIDGKKIFTLLEVTTSIQKALAQRYSSSFWVKAEMNKLNYYPHSGHCYPDLVEKQEGKIIAQFKSTLWRDDYLRINNHFLKILKAPLTDGIVMLFCARITFDPVHGLALRITDIDPVFSLGELEREKQESITRLQQEGVFNCNKSLSFPLLPQRLAIISVETSKGYADFNKMIQGNPWGYKFFHVLFPSLLQGERAIESIRYQLDRIRKVAHHFDVVAIIRGGGAEAGLSCFNDYVLAREIALFPLPVITGIGHATNETVTEMVAFRNAITPTELADFLLQRFHNFSMPVQRAQEILVARSKQLILEERQRLRHTVKFFRSITDNVLIHSHHEVLTQERALFKQANVSVLQQQQLTAALIYKLRNLSMAFCKRQRQEMGQNSSMMQRSLHSFIKHQHMTLTNLSKTVDNMHPKNVLKRGYSIARVNGQAVSRIDQVRAGDAIETVLSDGLVISQAMKTKKSALK